MQKTARPPLAFGQVWGTGGGGVSSHEKGERERRKEKGEGGGATAQGWQEREERGGRKLD